MTAYPGEYPQPEPPPATPAAPSTDVVGVDCVVCNHNGGNFCKGCGGTAGGFGFPPCKRCRAVIAQADITDANEGDTVAQQIIDCGGPLSGGYCE